jgi:hypothetical protein
MNLLMKMESKLARLIANGHHKGQLNHVLLSEIKSYKLDYKLPEENAFANN